LSIEAPPSSKGSSFARISSPLSSSNLVGPFKFEGLYQIMSTTPPDGNVLFGSKLHGICYSISVIDWIESFLTLSITHVDLLFFVIAGSDKIRQSIVNYHSAKLTESLDLDLTLTALTNQGWFALMVC
jgi:hypothetical protein